MSRTSSPTRRYMISTRDVLRVTCLLSAAALSATLVACAGSAAPTTDDTSSEPPREACSLEMEPGINEIALMSGGISRPFLLYVPASYDGHTAIPVVINGHGSTSDGMEHLSYSGMMPVADEHGFAIAAPTGAVQYTRGYIWHFPGFPLFGGDELAPEGTADDDLMIRDLIAELPHVICADQSRIYATGFSAGGRMASRLACSNSELVAAIGAVGGLRAGPEPDPADCHPSRPMPVIAFHGDADPINKFEGGTGTATNFGYGVEAAVEQWASINGCDAAAEVETLTPTVDRASYGSCSDDAEVEFYTIEGGGHTWPGSGFPLPAEQFGETDMSINASELMWEFFESHRLPAP